MPLALLRSQFQALEQPFDDEAITVRVDDPPSMIVDQVIDSIFPSSLRS